MLNMWMVSMRNVVVMLSLSGFQFATGLSIWFVEVKLGVNGEVAVGRYKFTSCVCGGRVFIHVPRVTPHHL